MDNERYYCGIDVSKESFSVAVKNTSFVIENKNFLMDKTGFEKMEKVLSPFKQHLVVGMESTGIYHKNLFYFLKDSGYNTTVVNPYKVKQFFKFVSDKPTKTDNKDAKIICQFVQYQGQNAQFPQEERYHLRYLVREKEYLTGQIARTKTEIRRILSLVFPELERTDAIFSSGIVRLLKVFPSAYIIKNTSENRFIRQAEKLLSGTGRKLHISPSQIYQLATQSIAYHYPEYEKLLLMKIESLEMLASQLENINKIITDMAEKLFKRELEILTSIPGVGKQSAIYFISEIVDIKRFDGWRKLIGFCGLDPVIKQSGNYTGKWKLSKRGNRHARRITFIMASCTKRSCPYFRDIRLKKRNEGKSYTEAVVATSTKLLRTIYALLSQDKSFV
ncbi:MAG: IS110 family transposase [Candidatus Omnitrophica bacterium]|nr:IS110 family transposase [Candidatus Omnitrophota bacterium]